MRLLLVTLLMVLAACEDFAARTPQHPAAEMLAVLEHGAAAWPEPPRPVDAVGDEEPPPPPPNLEPPPEPFFEYDDNVRRYLFGRQRCKATRNHGVRLNVYDEADVLQRWLERGLAAADPVVRLRALVPLVRARESESLALQLQTLRALRRELLASDYEPVLARLFEAFTLAEVENGLQARWDSARQRWAVRLAAALHHVPAIPRLVEISCSGRAHVRYVADDILDRFEFWRVREELARMVRGEGSLAREAFCKLLRRDPHRLCRELQAVGPGKFRQLVDHVPYIWTDDACVPAFCAFAGACPGYDRMMFSMIEGFAKSEHRALVEFLPRRVGPEHRQRACEVVAAVAGRLGW